MALDPRRLLSLARAARKAGITRLRLPDGTEMDLGPGPVAQAPARVKEPPPKPEVGSAEYLRQRFSHGA